MKRHYITKRGTACGREGWTTERVGNVTCLNCQKRPEYITAENERQIQHKAAFEAQTPRRIREPWHQEVVYMVCKQCGHNLFREGDRTCYGHYAEYYCGQCGGNESRLTETGMSF